MQTNTSPETQDRPSVAARDVGVGEPGTAGRDDRLLRLLAPRYFTALSPAGRYGLALLFVVAATAARWALMPWVGQAAPYYHSFVVGIVTTVLLGLGPGILFVLLCDAAVEVVILGSLPSLLAGVVPWRFVDAVLFGLFLACLLHLLRNALLRAREGEKRFRAAFEQSAVAMSIAALDGRLVQVNAAYGRMLGYSDAALRSLDFFSITHPDDLPANRAGLQQLVQGVTPAFRMEKRYVHQDGHLVWGDMSTVIVHDAAGQPRYFLTHVVDITERKQAEEAVRTTLQRFYQVLSNMYSAILLVSADERIEFANPAFCDYFALPEAPDALVGLSAGEMIARIKERYLHPDDAMIRIRAILAQGLPVHGEEVAMRDGKCCLRDFVPLIIQDRLYGRLWIHYDITASKQAEEAVRAREVLLHAILDQLPCGVTIREMPSGTMLLMNEQADILLGTAVPSFDEMARYQGVHADGRPYRREDYALIRAAEQGEIVRGEEFTFRRGDEMLTLSVSAAPVRDADGRITAAVAVFDDITARKQVEAALAQLASFPRLNPNPIVEVDMAGQVHYRNPPAEMLFPDLAEQGLAHPWLGEWAAVAAPLRVAPGEVAVRDVVVGDACYQQAIHYVSATQRFRIYGVDITARKRAEEALRESEERFRASFAQGGIGMAMSAPDGTFLRVNTALCTMLGYREEELIARSAFALTHPDDIPGNRAGVARLISGETTTFRCEKRYLHRDGSVVWVDLSTVAVRASAGTPAYLVSHMVDITARKRAEEALRASERHVSEILESIRDGFFAVDHDWRLTYVNQQAARNLGKTPDEMVGKIIWEAFPHILGTVQETQYRKAMAESHPLVFELTGLITPRSYEIRCYPTGEGLSVYCIDITARKQAEEVLRVSEQRERERAEEMAVLLEAVPTGVYISHDPACLHMTGNHAADAILRTPHGNELSLTGPAETRPSHFRPMKDGRELRLDELPAQRSARGEQITDFEFTLAFDDGLVRHVLGYGTPLLDAQGQPRGSVAVLVDITARKQMEEALQASLHEKEVLLQEIHHRVKNNMQVISSLVSLQADTLDNQALRPLFNDLRDQVRTMALVHEKLYQSASLARIDFAEYTRGLLGYLWRAHGDTAAHVRLTLDVQPVALSVETAVPCGLILNELVTNALKHAFRDRADGGVTVALSVLPDGRVCLRVGDNGPGLPAGLDWRTSSSLGLRLVQMLTEQINGTVEVTTDGGTEFAITFAPAGTA